jgi:hypothetical protein
MLQSAGSAIPIPGIAVIAFNLVEDSVNPGGGGVGLVLLHDLMGRIPLARYGRIYGLEEILLHN